MKPGPLQAGARLLVGVPVLLALLWAAGMLTATRFGLPTAPDLTLWALPVVQVVRDLTGILMLGAVAVGAFIVPGGSVRILRWASLFALAWALSAALLAILLISDVLAVPLGEGLQPATARSVLSVLTSGQILVWQFAVGLLVAALAWAVIGRVTSWAVLLLATSGVAATGLAGHSGIASGHGLATLSLALHVVAASLWVGGLLVVVLFLSLEPTRATTVLPRFSLLALVCAVTVAESGLFNASLRFSSVAQFVGTWYGALVVAKALLLACLLRLGWLQRERTLRRLPTDRAASLSSLSRLAASEFLVMGVAVALGTAMSRIGPTPKVISVDYNPMMVVLLTLALPQVVLWLDTERWLTTRFSRLRDYPEIAAIALLVVVAEVAGLGLMNALLPDEVAVVLGGTVLVVLGLGFAIATTGDRRAAGALIAMVGWPVATWFVLALDGQGDTAIAWRPQFLALLLGELILLLLLGGRIGGRLVKAFPAGSAEVGGH